MAIKSCTLTESFANLRCLNPTS
ncbi:hypothetical protein MED222_05160 [Vibrio sp. MED222]|nr:hypothetical protein MED222_05160 [Vibrio sp. MED222]